MKIVGITYYDGVENIVLKSDSSMLVNRKPLFVPEAIGDLQALPCWVLRVSRLGKCIAPRFASRYYDAVAAGMDYFGADLLREAKRAGQCWTEAVAFEGSLAIGTWQPAEDAVPSASQWQLQRGDECAAQAEWPDDGLKEIFNNAVARISDILTIRQGDLLYVAHKQAAWSLKINDIVRCVKNDEEQLYCKIK